MVIMRASGLDDLDLQILHALQVEPRVPWTALAPILGSDPATLARRWARIERAGFAWLTTLPGSADESAAAIIEFSCAPGQATRTAEELSLDPSVYSIDLTSGRRDLVATLVAPNDAELAEAVIERFGRLTGVRSVQSHIVNLTLRLGSNWTVRALSDAQVDRIPAPRPPRAGSARHVDPTVVEGMRRVLERDGRASYGTIAERLGISPQRAGDYLARLRQTDRLLIRADVSGPYSTWPIVSWFFIQAPTATIESSAAKLAEMPEVQFATVVTGPYNVIVAVSSKSRAEVVRREADLERSLPGARIVDRSMVLRVHKHLGRLISPEGFATGESIPLA
ncbi:Lrp/AsnC family transcriptional regulator [Agromyces allii]|nr:Lrp/AsnC family transcriptional regulator [Agromyces allii]